MNARSESSMFSGWTQVAFAEELDADVVPVDVAGRALVAVRRPEGYTVYDGRCPHRGAHLGYGGRLEEQMLVCPFHGHRVRLADFGADAGGSDRFHVREHPTVQAAGGLFVLLDPRHDTGLGARLVELERSHFVHPAFTRTIAVPPEYVVENVLDADHFTQVHALAGRPDLTVCDGQRGSLVVDGYLQTHRPNVWQRAEPDDGGTRARFTAEVFSPTVVVTALRSGADTNVVVTAATPTADGGCVARVTVALPRHASGGTPTVRHLSSLISGSRTAFEQDALVWEHLDPSVVPQYVEGDRLVRAFRDFCLRFEGG